jgi:hypothetical protein
MPRAELVATTPAWCDRHVLGSDSGFRSSLSMML